MSPEPKPRPLPRCPVCGRRATEATRPFCSTRCAQVDLGRWLSGGYAIPGEDDDAQSRKEEPR